MELCELLPWITAITTAPLSAWLTAFLLRRKYDAEVEQLRAQVKATKADTRGDELENVKKAMAILMEEVVEPLKKEIHEIRKELALLRRAVEKANSCPYADYADACPVRNELRRAEAFEGRAREPTG